MLPSRLPDLVEFFDLPCSDGSPSASASDLVCALGVSDQPWDGGTEVLIGGGETGLVEYAFEGCKD